MNAKGVAPPPSMRRDGSTEALNLAALARVKESKRVRVKAAGSAAASLREGKGRSVLSFSHFLPCRQALPDWMEPEVDSFDPAWLKHPAAATAMKFSKVAALRCLMSRFVL